LFRVSAYDKPFLAAGNGDIPTTLSITDWGSLTTYSANRRSVLSCACEGGNTELVTILLQRHADPSQYQSPSLQHSFIRAQHESIKILINYMRPEEIKYWMNGIRDTTSLQILYDHNIDLSSSLLHKISGLEIAQYLLSHGADVNAIDPSTNRNPLHYANDPDVASFLVHAGTKIEQRDNDGMTPLNILSSSIFDLFSTIDALLNEGADINSRNNIGRSPLLSACEMGNVSTVRVLLDHGADISVRDDAGRSVYDMPKLQTVERRNREIAKTDKMMLIMLHEYENNIK